MKTLLLISALLMTACSTNETFDCKAGKGVGCKSITEVNQLVNGGAFGDSTTASSVQTLSPVLEFSEDASVHRIQEQHLRVWMAPFQDDQGNLHEGSTVHTVLKPGYWTMRESL